jgi:diguanylate cyclase (GGDEF)-like protein
MSDMAQREDARLADHLPVLPAESLGRLNELVAATLHAEGTSTTYHAWVGPMEGGVGTEVHPQSFVRGESAWRLPPGAPPDTGALAMVPLADETGSLIDPVNNRSFALYVACTATQPWKAHELAAIGAMANVACTELKLRFQLAKQEAVADTLRKYPLHDPVTELANRELFLDRVGQALMRAARQTERHMAVMSVTINQFHDIERSFGYETAQQMVKEVATRMRVAVRTVDSVARISSNEFGVLVESLRDDSDAARVAKRIHETLRAPIRTSWDQFIVSASVGVVMSSRGVDSPPRLLQLAGLARERSRDSASAYELFDPAMQLRARSRLNQETELRGELEAGDFELHYQPIVSLETKRLVELEALVRWRRGGQLIGAAEFIPLAEATGLVVPLGWTVLTQACEQLRAWRGTYANADGLSVSINFSAAHLAHQELVDRIRSALVEFGLPKRALNIELTESLFIDAERARKLLDEVRALGVGVHIDDFGTGYSSLQYLHELPLDAIKIDRRFIARVGGDSRESQVAGTIRELARQIGVPVIAEGVETEAQLDHVRSIGCEFAQGFLFSHPMPAADISALLERPIETI